jgi:hypothetical protein
MNELKDQTALDINMLVKYVMWSKDKIAGGVSKENAIESLSRIVDYDLNLMKSISGVENKDKDYE